MIDKKYAHHDCAMYGDQFEIVARQDKDDYCEKPCSMTMEECWALAGSGSVADLTWATRR